MSDINLQEVHDFFITIAKKAGEMILTAGPAASASGSKKNSTDLVTETDRAVEKMVSESLRERYPDFKFMGEETYQPGDTLTPSPTFIVDPIDGTTNFIHSNPYACISLGLAVNLTPVVGVIYNPFIDQLFTAIKDQGSYLTDRFHDRVKLPLKPLEEFTGLDKCLVIAEWGYDRSGNDYDVKVRTFRRLCASKEDGGAMVRGVRSLGSAALNLCSLAAGWTDLYWDAGCWAWDVCAGWVVLKEAGGEVVGGSPGVWKPAVDERRYLAIRGGEGWEMVVKEFWGCIEGELEVGK
ncbi:Inositol-1-monophosphatase [Dactylella cylindrospora]|nr:Inositol-1-monophosphatase [Dactylella cylindrospora]